MDTRMSFGAGGLAAIVPACGGGGGDPGGGGSGAGTGTAGEGGGGMAAPPLLESCEAICDKQTALECAQFTAEQCKMSCPYLEQNLGEGCLKEYEVYYGCQASLEYECVQGYPSPVAAETCFDASYAVSDCSQKLPCINYCKQAAALPCGPADEEKCVTQCAAETSYQGGGSSCQNDLLQLRQCQGMDGALACNGDSLTTTMCPNPLYDYVSCISSDESDWCEGYCVAVEASGCAPTGIDDCLLSCQEQKFAGSGSCDYYYEDLIECRAQVGIDCSGGTVSDVGCETQLMSYQSCVAPPP
jgi:hypothetical protein